MTEIRPSRPQQGWTASESQGRLSRLRKRRCCELDSARAGEGGLLRVSLHGPRKPRPAAMKARRRRKPSQTGGRQAASLRKSLPQLFGPRLAQAGPNHLPILRQGARQLCFRSLVGEQPACCGCWPATSACAWRGCAARRHRGAPSPPSQHATKARRPCFQGWAQARASDRTNGRNCRQCCPALHAKATTVRLAPESRQQA